MNIGLFTDSDVFAGTERHILDLAWGLREEGARPTILCPGQGVLAQRAGVEGIPVIDVKKRRGLDWPAVRLLARGWRKGLFDVVHAHNGRTAFLGAVARLFTRRGALVSTEHFLTPARDERRGMAAALSRRLHRWRERRTQAIIAISQAVRGAIATRGDGGVEKVRVVLNGISEPHLQALEAPAEVRERFKIPAHAPLIVCVARLEKEKCVHDLIDAMETLLAGRPDARCVIAGAGAEEAALRRQIARAEIGHAVHLAGFQSDPLSLIRAADVFVLPSGAEPFGLVLLEAMALGIPTVATKAGGPMEIVVHGQTGWLVEPRKSDAFAATLWNCLQQPEKAREMGRKGRELYLSRFTANQMAKEMLTVYRECLAAGAGKSVASDEDGQEASKCADRDMAHPPMVEIR